MNYDALAELLFPDIKETPNYYENLYPKRNLKDNEIVTRFAPSPTGFVHMGSLYVAFLNRLLTNQFGGIFYLRIEDTDQKREVKDGVKIIKDSLDYFKLDIDESLFKENIYGPYLQSERKTIYQTYIKDMIKKGLAYPCFCKEEELEETRKKQELVKVRTGYYGKWKKCDNLTFNEILGKINNHEPFVIRLKTPKVNDEKIICHDLIKGDVLFPANDIDLVIMKSDGLTTYHFAHVIDDHLMRTSLVIRGDEWLSSLPIHLQLFNMLELKAPKYAHISPLTKKDGNSIRKLSKRKDPECAISFYQELGIPVEALKLYFATLANSNFEEWYNSNNANIEEFKFTFDKMPIGGTLFDIDKLMNISKIYFSKKNANSLYDEALDYYKNYDIIFYQLLLENKDYAIQVLNIERNRERPRKDIGCYKDIKKEIFYMFDELFNNVSYEEIIKDKNYDVNILDEYLNNCLDNNDTEDEWYNKVKELASKLGYAPDTKSYKQAPDNYKGHVGNICEMIRVVLTGRLMSPSLYEIQKVLGIDRIKRRFNHFKEILLQK